MSTKTIPAQIIKTCDGCDVKIDAQNSRQEGKLTLNVHALDMHGHACADATRKLDLCDSCLYKVAKAIEAALKDASPTTSADSRKGE